MDQAPRPQPTPSAPAVPSGAVRAELDRLVPSLYHELRRIAERSMRRERVGHALEVRVVELRYFAGLTVEETADVLEISPATVKRDWAVARAWLYRELSR